MSATIIDRRLNPSGKNLGNRQRFIRRAKEQIKKSVKEGFLDRSITSDKEQQVSVPVDGISEPRFRHNPGSGNQDYVLPGNDQFTKGDLINKPEGGDGDGDPDASDSGEGQDGFVFNISSSEFADLLFDDLELPDLIKKKEKKVDAKIKARSGFTNSGNPANLDLERSMINGIARRVALKTPKLRQIHELEDELEGLLNEDPLDESKILSIQEEIASLRRKANAVSFLDPVDLRYRNFEVRPNPIHQAVMFCVMDVSGSMGQHEKDLAKRFYFLLYLFLKHKYKKVEVVFIRHHSEASECTEDEFFYDKETGGTIVSSGFKLMDEIVKERYPVDAWNIYVANASDGDNFDSDNDVLSKLLRERILPIVQYFAYIEVGRQWSDYSYNGEQSNRPTSLWNLYADIKEDYKHMVMRGVKDPMHVYAVFRGIFEKAK